jgi:hypothetical protein
MRRPTGVTAKLGRMKNMDEMPIMIAIAPTNSRRLCASLHSVALYYLFRWHSVALEKINMQSQLLLATKTVFR